MTGGKPQVTGAGLWSETGAVELARSLDDWLSVGEDGTVTVYSGKVELGTGVRTALAQIVAEELDVPFESVHLVMGDTGRTPNEGYTAGSKTIQFGGNALRLAAAQARQILVELAAKRFGVSPDQVAVDGGLLWPKSRPEQRTTIAELSGGRRFERNIELTTLVKRPEEYRIVGSPLRRVEIPGKLFGTGSFIQDMKLPGMLHGRVVRPPAPGALLLSVDVATADGAQVVRVGSFLGVVAEREEEAVRASRSLSASWSAPTVLPRMAEIAAEIRKSTTVDQEGTATGELSQGVYPLRGALAELLELPIEKVRVIHLEGAGCYGHNGADDVAADAALLSRAVGRPVRVQWSRKDEFAWEPYGPAMVTEMKGAVGGDGRISAWEHETWSPSHSSRPRSAVELLAGQLAAESDTPAKSVFGGGDRNASVSYEIASSRVAMHWLVRSPLRASSFRSLGAFANTFANESFIDELAAAAKIDPLEMRLRHLSDERARAVLEEAARRSEWGRRLAPGEGLGLAFVQYENYEAYVATIVRLRVAAQSGEITVEKIVVAHDCGLIINPDGLKNQIEGNIIQGLSRTLKEQVTWDESAVTSVDWKSYPILTFSEIPKVEIILIDRPHEKAVGAGEPATITVAPAVANAVYAASGVRVRELPITPERVLAARR